MSNDPGRKLTDAEIDKLVKDANEGVGDNPPDNRCLAPQEHAPRLAGKPQAAPLHRILTEDPTVTGIIREYLEYDPSALEMQTKYKRCRNWILGVLAVTIFLGGARIVLDWWHFMHEVPHLLVTLAVYLALIIPLVLAWIAARKNYSDLWRINRAKAEALRVRLFEEVFDAKTEHDPATELPPLPLKMAYFRRYQYQLQRDYHARRNVEFSRSGRIAGALFVVLAGLVVVWLSAFLLHVLAAAEDNYAIFGGLGPAGYVASYYNRFDMSYFDNWALLAAIILGILFTISILYMEFDKTQRNSARHQIAKENFEYLAPALEDACRAAARGDEVSVRSFVARVHSIMSNETADWVRLKELDKGIKGENTPATESVPAPA